MFMFMFTWKPNRRAPPHRRRREPVDSAVTLQHRIATEFLEDLEIPRRNLKSSGER